MTDEQQEAPSSRVLRAVPVPIRLYDLDAQGEVVGISEHLLRFDANVLADIEERYDGTIGYSQKLVARVLQLEDGPQTVTVTALDDTEVADDGTVTRKEPQRLDGMAAWNYFLAVQPNRTVRDTIAMMIGDADPRDVGRRMIETESGQYAAAVGAAFAIANGVDPTVALAEIQLNAATQMAVAAVLERDAGSPDAQET